MGVITITGEKGALGDIPAIVASQHGADLVDRQIPHELARRLGWNVHDIEAMDERVGGFRERLLHLLDLYGAVNGGAGLATWPLGGMPQWYVEPPRTIKEQYSTALRQLLLAYGSRPDVVIVGRGAASVLAGNPSALHVRIDCPFEVRVQRVATRDLYTQSEAERIVRADDAQRRAWYRRYLAERPESPRLYDLVLNSGRMPDAQIAELICDAARTVTRARPSKVGAF